MTTVTENIFEFAIHGVESHAVSVDGRPIGYVIDGHYGWVAENLNCRIIGHNFNSMEEAAEALWNI